MYRIMVADDEEDIREGIAYLIRNRRPGWEVDASARDGAEALQRAMTFLPHMVLTDINMPHMNGLDFLENLKGLLPEAKLLVLSGYDQFDYAVQAMRLGVSDYLTKPVDVDKLLGHLDVFCSQWEQTQNARRVDALHIYLEKTKRVEVRNFFQTAIQGSKLPELSEAAAKFTRGNAFCCVLSNSLNGHEEQLEEILNQRLNSQHRWVWVAAEKPAEAGIVFWSDQVACSELFLQLNQLLEAIAVECRRTYGQKVRFFIGSVLDAPSKLAISYRRSLYTMNYTFPDDATLVTSYNDVLENSLLPCEQIPKTLRMAIITAVGCGNRNAFFEKCQELFTWFQQKEILDAAYVRMCILGLCYGILNESQTEGALSYYEYVDFQSEIMASGTLEELQTNFENFVRLRWLRQDSSNQPKPSIAQRVESIAQQHLADIEFTLDDVAALLFISPNYLRQLFKRETGQTFTEFLTTKRMEHAKILLGNPKLKISSVSEQCGYADSRYFSVCFKKYWHMTPSEYQASVQGNER